MQVSPMGKPTEQVAIEVPQQAQLNGSAAAHFPRPHGTAAVERESHCDERFSSVVDNTVSPHDEHIHYAVIPLQLSEPLLQSQSRANITDQQQEACGETVETSKQATSLYQGHTSSNQLPNETDQKDTPIGHPALETVSAHLGLNQTATPISHRINPRPTFARLPGEIRNHVYKYLLSSESSTLILSNNDVSVANGKPLLRFLPGLAYITRQTYFELGSQALKNHVLEVRNIDDLYHLEDALHYFPGQKGWGNVTSLRISRFSDLATSPARTREVIDYLLRLPNLEHISLHFRLARLHLPASDPTQTPMAWLNGVPPIKNAEQVFSDYDLNLLLRLLRLRKLTMVCEWNIGGPVANTPVTMNTFWDLQDWLARQFSMAGKVVRVGKSPFYDNPCEEGTWDLTFERATFTD